MAYEQKPNTGSLFKNDRRETETQPHAKGSALVDGVEYWVSAWTNVSDKGTRYQSLAFTRKEQQTQDASKKTDASKATPEFDDDLPF